MTVSSHRHLCLAPRIANGKAASRSIKHHISRRAKRSRFFELHKVVRPILDATFLRANKQFYNEGIKLLYSQNIFSFNLRYFEYTYVPPRVVFTTPPYRDFSNGVMYKPEPIFSTDDEWLSQVKEGTSQMQYRRPPLMLLPSMYADPFLRFLSTIGPDNSACLRSLRFDECGKLYCSCSAGCSDECDSETGNKLKTYNWFMRELCKGLTRLSIYVSGGNDHFAENLDHLCEGLENLEDIEVCQYMYRGSTECIPLWGGSTTHATHFRREEGATRERRNIRQCSKQDSKYRE